jgi:hypothetical protein
MTVSMSHHYGESVDLVKKFMEQVNGTGNREYPQGRIGADDDGALSYAITNDDRHRTIIIRFPKPVEWVGLGIDDAVALRDNLTERIAALRGVDLKC